MVRRVRLVREYDVLAAAGDDARIYRLPLVTYALGRDVLLMVFEPGDRPDGTGVRDASSVTVTRPFPDEIYSLLYCDTTSGFQERPSTLRVEGYVRLAGGCVPLGSLRSFTASIDERREQLWSAGFTLDVALPFGVLDRIRSAVAAPPGPDAPDTRWVRLLPDDPVGALREFVTTWYADVVPPSGRGRRRPCRCRHRWPSCTPLSVAGRNCWAATIRCSRNTSCTWTLRGGCSSGPRTRGASRWRPSRTATTPPVWFLHRGMAEPERNPLPLSRFLLASMLVEATLVGHYTMWGQVWQEDKDRALNGLLRVPLATRGWQDWNAETYAGRGLVVRVTPPDAQSGTWGISAGARRREDLRAVERFRDHRDTGNW